ncbi:MULTISPECIES: hypothetical protein [unclassified Lentimicrobium]|uniref:hypothetical protein n=1 Tax=unclassified Lentimicrobium TaxID=2677434 RepID=UPI001557D3A5|nr:MULTISPECIES: hypothetical protein [unclassified Lentimicrobium]NPD44589.1 hypothetical protein [Lentimicrobium sp. S6]NPD83301.1 hypothetical protein [Lentimicrobium sp. L6]
MRHLISILFFLLTISSYSQESNTDTIFLNDGTIIHAKVLKQKLGKSITYKSENGSITVISWKDIQKYYIDNKLTITKDTDPKTIKKKSYLDKGYNEYAAFGLGIGNAYGGLGAHLQIRGGKTLGFGGHFGAGYLPGINGGNNSFGWNIGAKFYYFKYLFIDLTYGVVGFSDWGHTVLGPSVLIGGDFIFSEHIGLNVAVGASKYNKYQGATLDLGLLIKLSSPKKKSETPKEI